MKKVDWSKASASKKMRVGGTRSTRRRRWALRRQQPSGPRCCPRRYDEDPPTAAPQAQTVLQYLSSRSPTPPSTNPSSPQPTRSPTFARASMRCLRVTRPRRATSKDGDGGRRTVNQSLRQRSRRKRGAGRRPSTVRRARAVARVEGR